MKIKVESSCISRKRCFLYTILLFILAGVFEIGGGYLVWLWLRENKGALFGLLGGLIFSYLWSHPNLSIGKFWKSFCCIRRNFYYFLSYMGLFCR
ncbi:hypothetical protein DU74_11195 [Methanosarcina mazei]|uniref:YnfA family protein n=1 Tax=Methanosarcina mazei TaxID=2209 RepID=A0A0F8PCC5_METMZ|nr:hypothetical protein [Methanosarcina mazei]KKH60343.1 hypothetical protein DU74_11195 [Methanosarcina mazei]